MAYYLLIESVYTVSFFSTRFAAMMTTIVCECFNFYGVWMYVLCARVVIAHKEALVRSTSWNMDDVQRLQEASRYLHGRLHWLLMINCCLVVVVMFTSLFYVTISNFSIVSVSCWDVFCTAEMFLRLVLICHTADTLTDSVRTLSNCIVC